MLIFMLSITLKDENYVSLMKKYHLYEVMQPRNYKVNFISTLLEHRNYTLMESVSQLTM